LAHKILRALEWIGTEAETATRETCRSVGYEFESYESACERIVNDINTLADRKVFNTDYVVEKILAI
jgi:hypothetical protein